MWAADYGPRTTARGQHGCILHEVWPPGEIRPGQAVAEDALHRLSAVTSLTTDNWGQSLPPGLFPPSLGELLSIRGWPNFLTFLPTSPANAILSRPLFFNLSKLTPGRRNCKGPAKCSRANFSENSHHPCPSRLRQESSCGDKENRRPGRKNPYSCTPREAPSREKMLRLLR